MPYEQLQWGNVHSLSQSLKGIPCYRRVVDFTLHNQYWQIPSCPPLNSRVLYPVSRQSPQPLPRWAHRCINRNSHREDSGSDTLRSKVWVAKLGRCRVKVLPDIQKSTHVHPLGQAGGPPGSGGEPVQIQRSRIKTPH